MADTPDTEVEELRRRVTELELKLISTLEPLGGWRSEEVRESVISDVVGESPRCEA